MCTIPLLVGTREDGTPGIITASVRVQKQTRRRHQRCNCNYVACFVVYRDGTGPELASQAAQHSQHRNVDGFTRMAVQWSLSHWCAPCCAYCCSARTPPAPCAAHDAWHRSLTPGWPGVNDALGRVALLLHGYFDFQKLKRIHLAHHVHHNNPDKDPDMPPGPTAMRFVRWFINMGMLYSTPQQALCYAAHIIVCRCVFSVPPLHVLLFIIVPFAASVLRLFVFLTYLPHTVEPCGPTDAITTFVGPKWVALALGFNAVYHAQHHCWPHLPWWRLSAEA